MPGEDLILSDADRLKLDKIVGEMTSNNESDEDVQFVVNDFKSKYGLKKKEISNTPSPSPLLSSVTGSGLEVGKSESSAPDYMGGTNQTVLPSASANPVAPENPLLVKGVDIGKPGASGLDYMGGMNQPIPETPAEALPTITNESDQLRAATTQAEITPPDQLNLDPDLGKKELGQNPYSEAFRRGTVRLGNSILKSPAFVYDIASTITNEVINKPLGINAAPSSEQIASNIPEEYNVTRQLDDAIKRSSEITSAKYDQGINDYFFGDKKDVGKGLELIAQGVLESAPTTMAILFGNAAGASEGAIVGAGGVAFGADKMSEIERENPENMSQTDRVSTALLSGLAEGIGEQMFGITKIAGLTKDVLKKSGKEAAEKVAKESFTKAYGQVLKRYVGVGAEEVTSEMATQFAQNVIDKYSGLNPDMDLLQGVADAGYIALGSTGPMVTPTAVLDVMVTKKNRDKAAELIETKKALQDDLSSPEVNDNAKSIISEKIKDINEQEADLAKEEKDKVSALPPESKIEINSLQEQANKIVSAAADETVSEQTKEIFKKDLEDIDKQIDKIFEDANNAPKETKAPETKQEALPVTNENQDEIDYLTEIKNSIGLQPEEEARLLELQPKVEKEISSSKKEKAPTEIKSEEPIPNVDVSEIEKQIEENKKSWFNEKIPYTEYRKKNDELNKILNQQKEGAVPNQEPVIQQEAAPVVEPEKAPVENKESENIVVDNKPEVKAEQKEEVTPPEKPKEKPKNELLDEEDMADDVKDSPEAKQRLDDDIEAMKQMKTKDLSEKKFVGMIERAWKAKEDGKISRPTYTKFRNKAKDILAGKVSAGDNVEATEVTLRVTAAMNKVKEKLVGQGYKKITLSSVSPITPQTVADLIDLTTNLINRGVRAGFTVAEATKKALEIIKKNPVYKKLVASNELNEKEFDDSINGVSKEPETKTDSKKNEGGPDIFGETRKKKTADRQEASPNYKDILSEMEESDKFYESIDSKKAVAHVNKMLDKLQSEGLLEGLANKILKDENPFHEKIANMAAGMLVDRLRVVAQKEGNDLQKSHFNKLAAKVNVMRLQNVNVAATQTAMEQVMAEMLPLSEEGLKDFANAAMSNMQDSYLDEKNKKDIANSVADINEIINSKEFQDKVNEAVEKEIDRMAEELNGKEWLDLSEEAANELKIDVKDC